MNHDWSTADIVEDFTLLPSEITFLGSNDPHNHLGKALLLKFFQKESRFPEDLDEIPPEAIEYVAQQLDLPPSVIDAYDWNGRRVKDHRRDIRDLLGFRPATVADQHELRAWLMADVLPDEHRSTHLEQLVYQQLRRSHLEPPSKKQVARLIRSAIHRYEQAFFAQTAARLSEAAKARLRQLIEQKGDLAANSDPGGEGEDGDKLVHYPLHDLKTGAGEAKVANIKKVAGRLKLLQEICLPSDLFTGIPLRFLRQYQQQTAVESVSHLQRRERKRKTGPRSTLCWPHSAGSGSGKSQTSWSSYSSVSSKIFACVPSTGRNASCWPTSFVWAANSSCCFVWPKRCGITRMALSARCYFPWSEKNGWRHWCKRRKATAATANLCRRASAVPTPTITGECCRRCWRC